MNILGVEITFKRANSQKALPPPDVECEEEEFEADDKPKAKKKRADSMAAIANVIERKAGNGATLKTFRKKNPVFDQIIFPEPEDPDDPWQQQALANLVNQVNKMYTDGWFSVCVPREAIKRFNIPQNYKSQLAMEKLRVLHCVHFDKMLPELYDQIPGLLTCIFTGGEISPKGH